MPNPFTKLTSPWYPSTALGLERGMASIVDLDGGRGKLCSLRRAATIKLADSLISPSFEESNIADVSELTASLSELAASAGLLRQKRWSVTLPEGTTRSLIVTLESSAGSSRELEEVLTWKVERSFGATLDELSVSRERLNKDAQGRERYLMIATRVSVLAEYENVLSSLGWRAGLILPRHLGEAQWLTRNGFTGDSLLLSSWDQGFTGIVFRERQPLILRSVVCEPEDREDEFYRLLLFYRDRRTTDIHQAGELLSGLLVLGEGFKKERVSEIVNETLGRDLRPLDAEDLGLQLPTRELSFDAIAAPAGLATFSL